MDIVEVSIIMPAFNCEEFIEESIDSVISQVFPFWELIIVDDQSSDQTWNILERKAKEDSRIKIFRNEKNFGAAYTRNYAISKSIGKYVAFLDGDDVWDIKKLDKQVNFMNENNFKFTYSYYDIIDKNNNRSIKYVWSPKKITYYKMIRMSRIGCLTVMVDGSIAKNNPIKNTIYRRNDYALWLKYLKFTDGFCLPEILASYRRRSGSISSVSSIKLFKSHLYVFRNSEDFSTIKSFLLALTNSALFLIYKPFKSRHK